MSNTQPDLCPPHQWTRGDVKESSYCLKCGIDANEPTPKEDVRVCECHPGIFWRIQSKLQNGKIKAFGFATRSGSFSGQDLVHSFYFEPAEWESLERA